MFLVLLFYVKLMKQFLYRYFRRTFNTFISVDRGHYSIYYITRCSLYPIYAKTIRVFYARFSYDFYFYLVCLLYPRVCIYLPLHLSASSFSCFLLHASSLLLRVFIFPHFFLLFCVFCLFA